MTVVGTIRLLVGAGLIAAGGTLAAPFAARLAEAAREPAAVRIPVAPGGQPPAVVPVAPVGLSAPSAAPTLTVTAPDPAAPLEQPAAFAGVAPPDSGGWLQLDRCPPPPPAPLPPPPTDVTRATPPLGAAYRSTLDVPPPPLLDAAAAPPAVVWPVAAAAPAAPVPLAELTVPATYRIRDGDDLGSIAGHFYGHPAAASAIWAANRETITHPDLLPIGAELRLPPPWSVHGYGRTTTGAIEPAAHVRPVALDPAGASGPAAVPPPWLAPVPVTTVPATVSAVAPAPAPPAGRAITVVTLGPGENLSMLAQRVYGDPALAEQVFLANRDRLRSPDLAVPGMELRLPRPVTAPVP